MRRERLLQSVGGVCRLVCWSVCPSVLMHVFSPTVAAVDTKRGNVGMCNGRSASKSTSLERCRPRTACLRRGPKIIIQLVYIPPDCMGWLGFTHPAETEETYIWKVSLRNSSRDL